MMLAVTRARVKLKLAEECPQRSGGTNEMSTFRATLVPAVRVLYLAKMQCTPRFNLRFQ